MSQYLSRFVPPWVSALAAVALAFSTNVLPATAQTAPADAASQMERHLEALQRIADENGGNRAAGTPGYRASVDYAVKVLEKAGYAVTRQPFEVTSFELVKKPVIAQVRPEARRLREERDYLVFDYSGSGSVQGAIVPARGIRVPPPADGEGLASGCSPDDFPPETKGAIALVQRGTCFFSDKIDNARRAGAEAVLIFNLGTAGNKEAIPVIAAEGNTVPAVFLSYEAGRDLFRSAEARRTVVKVDIRARTQRKTTWNVIADSRKGDPDRTLVVGGHLDSVLEGPGINDNGSGTALVLVAAQRLAERWEKPRNRVRFALWGAEELGLFGSTHYVTTLPNRERKQIFAYLNFDMVGSPNFVRFVDATRGNAASQALGDRFHAAFERDGLASGHTDSGGRTDTFAFIEAGIPAAGLFSGAEGDKTKSQQRRYGGSAGEPYDACYHQACDTIRNISGRALREFSEAALVVIRETARKTPPTAEAVAAAMTGSPAPEPVYRGPYALR